ncbi:hypothetical protein WG219_19310 [Ectopseudomonas mendocina]|uniref:Uncharacterized protein n=1 Tax=Ectopseudomonas mendocina TaxID=300 RepID=A0ABZ2RJQ1_ECTME
MRILQVFPLGLLLGCTLAFADGLPEEGSLLQRFGVQADELPLSQEGPAQDGVHFQLEPDSPLVQFKFEDEKPIETTGNPAIDAMRERDRRNCENTRQELIKRGGAPIECR